MVGEINEQTLNAAIEHLKGYNATIIHCAMTGKNKAPQLSEEKAA